MRAYQNLKMCVFVDTLMYVCMYICQNKAVARYQLVHLMF